MFRWNLVTYLNNARQKRSETSPVQTWIMNNALPSEQSLRIPGNRSFPTSRVTLPENNLRLLFSRHSIQLFSFSPQVSLAKKKTFWFWRFWPGIINQSSFHPCGPSNIMQLTLLRQSSLSFFYHFCNSSNWGSPFERMIIESWLVKRSLRTENSN